MDQVIYEQIRAFPMIFTATKDLTNLRIVLLLVLEKSAHKSRNEISPVGNLPPRSDQTLFMLY